MPSHSKKQHNFMEAIAHSPSFAKKVHIPQSVGKDYAAADKGKTFSKGGEMKESKGMVGKEVAFMKKKGAPKSMIKHEMSEMKRGGKVRRMAAGGTGDPFELSDTDRENYAKNGAENLKRLKGFFGFGDSSDEGERKPTGEQRKTVTAASPNVAAESKPLQAETKPVYKPTIRAELPVGPPGGSKSGEDDIVGGKPEAFNPALEEAREQAKRAKDAFKPASAPRRPKEISVEKTTVTASPGSQGNGAALYAAEKEAKKRRLANDASKKTESEPNFDEASGTERRYRNPSKIGVASDETRESVRRGLGRFADFFNLSKRHEQEFGKKAAKGGQVKRMRYGGSPDDGMDMGQPMRGMAPTPAPRGRGMQPYPEPMIESPRSPIEPPPKQPKGLPGQTPEDLIQEKNRKIFNSGMMQPSRPGGSPQIDGPGIKAGGQVKKMAQGGYAKADGVASRGKTQPKMVKMAKGGFVKTADGCAQRGKTKAFQVKMKRGGMC